jgi:hypothetical protein
MASDTLIILDLAFLKVNNSLTLLAIECFALARQTPRTVELEIALCWSPNP